MGESRIGSIGAGMMTQTSGIDIMKRQEEAAEVMFADMISMNGTTNSDNFTADVGDEMLSTIEANELDTHREKPADAYEKYQYKDKTIRTETSDSKSYEVEETVVEVKEFEEAVTEVVAEELQVSKEELEAAMEELGLSFLDLLDNGKLASLVVKLTGSENLNQLLCNESFTNVLQQVNELGTELMADVQMTLEELKEFASVNGQMSVVDVNEVAEPSVILKPEDTTAQDAEHVLEQSLEIIPEETVKDVVEEVSDEVKSLQNTKAENLTKAESVEETVELADDTVEMKEGTKVEVIHTEMSEDKQMDTAKVNLSDNGKQEFAEDDGKQKFAEDDGKQLAQVRTIRVNENVVVDNTQTVTFTEQLGEFETVQTLPPNVTVADIMDQFAEQTRVLISADTTKMEMQLNPEHLGKLYVEVIENEGTVTAKIQTQNTIVKEALEMQIADLKMNLNQAGVKVDSVEVTVANHEFERNLEQDANSRKQQEDAQPKAARHRNINLNGLDELSGLMSEEEALVAKMMAEQGNRVDFTA